MCILKNPVPKIMLRNYAVCFFHFFSDLQHVNHKSLFENSLSQFQKMDNKNLVHFLKFLDFIFMFGRTLIILYILLNI